ncbi:Alpha/Beta hydrolase protein [Polychytrium aggregatum]|uniref:Alpha/Beta hydrolase protein n=1 Tax=Polychytrium aggregatum TaxID=110093 RepID=UPI0022FF0F77|nr:Alpha/Beta hydrolase protein [Polychytrium aggregatum]KAI9206903.1 Alpha/Beta hydrolase protein [Polychytrium aggregatum]
MADASTANQPETSPAQLSECCLKGHLWDGQPAGTARPLQTNPNIQAYFAQPPGSAKAAIVIFTDVFGYELTNTRRLFFGDPATRRPEEFEGLMDPVTTWGQRWSQVGRMLRLGPHMASWIMRHTPKEIVPVIDATLAEVREHFGIHKIGTQGFCFGGKYAGMLAGSTQIQASSIVHPSGVSVPTDIKNIAVPVQFIFAEHDPTFTPANQKETERILQGRPEIDSEINFYPGTVHGFACRGDEKDPVATTARREALAKSKAFFQKHLLKE